ncbi:MAG: Fe-S protein assembly co-chaperone HscB [Gammaproteobacteria bacterium]|nr:Fe-S protein assembly co-chaperone HscB [Gammaproteobacteria bacterium]
MSDPLQQDYFTLFNLKPVYRVAEPALKAQYLALQQQYHPDRAVNADSAAQTLAVQRTAYINDAYQTLKHPLKRAAYLLEQLGYSLQSDGGAASRVMDPDFLLQQMTLHEELETLRHADNALDRLVVFQDSLRRDEKALQQELLQLFDNGSATALTQARERVQRMKFLQRLQEEILELESTLL